MEYKFAATLKKQALTTVKEKGEDGESYEVPRLTITLELQDTGARAVNARLSALHGEELVIVVRGNGVQLNLGADL